MNIFWKLIVTLVLIVSYPVICIGIFVMGGLEALFAPNQTTLIEIIKFIWETEV